MKLMLNVSAGIILSGMMLACGGSDKKETTFTEIDVKVGNIRSDVRLSEFADATVLPLPTSDSLLIGSIKQVRTDEKHICISDGNQIFRFSRSGEYLGCISKKGEGPDLYLRLNDFVMADDGVWVLSNPNEALYFYSWDNKMQKKLDLEVMANSVIHRLGDKMLFYTGNFITENSIHALKVVDLNTGKIINEHHPVDEYKSKYLYMFGSNLFTPSANDTVCFFSEAHNDTIYKVTPHTFQPVQVYHWDGNNIPSEFYRQDFPDIMAFNEKLSSGSTYGMGFHLYNKNYYWVNYFRKGHAPCAAVVPVEDGDQYVFEKMLVDELEDFPVSVVSDGWDDNKYVTSCNEIVFILQPMDIMEHIGEKAPQAMGTIKEKINYTSDDQNPVLLLVNLKE